ncbi:MAG: universal stress protein [Cocleimonas sp.]
MSYKDILVYLDDGKSNQERINTAFNLAKSQQARLTAVTLSALEPAHMIVKNETAKYNISYQEAEKRIAEFTEQATQLDIEFDTKIIDLAAGKGLRKTLAKFARNFDLVIFRQANPANKNFDLIESISSKIVVHCGRPVFFMPYIGAHHIPAKNALIAWDGTATATRAVHDSLPILKQVKEVTILVVTEGKKKTAKGELLADDLAAHLGRHGVNANVRRTTTGSYDVPTVILNHIAENSLDLLIMGSYGTATLQRKVFGGVTKKILDTMITPVIMSH